MGPIPPPNEAGAHCRSHALRSALAHYFHPSAEAIAEVTSLLAPDGSMRRVGAGGSGRSETARMSGKPDGVSVAHPVPLLGRGQEDIGAAVVGMVDAPHQDVGDEDAGHLVIGDVAGRRLLGPVSYFVRSRGSAAVWRVTPTQDVAPSASRHPPASRTHGAAHQRAPEAPDRPPSPARPGQSSSTERP